MGAIVYTPEVRGQKSPFSPSTMWDKGIKLKLSGLVEDALYPLSYLSSLFLVSSNTQNTTSENNKDPFRNKTKKNPSLESHTDNILRFMTK